MDFTEEEGVPVWVAEAYQTDPYEVIEMSVAVQEVQELDDEGDLYRYSCITVGLLSEDVAELYSFDLQMALALCASIMRRYPRAVVAEFFGQLMAGELPGDEELHVPPSAEGLEHMKRLSARDQHPASGDARGDDTKGGE